MRVFRIVLHPHLSKIGQAKEKRKKRKESVCRLTDSFYDYILYTVIQVESANVDPGRQNLSEKNLSILIEFDFEFQS